MPDHKKVYDEDARNYQRLIDREDYQNNLLPALQEITELDNLNLIDLGAGTGRLANLLAPWALSIKAFDISTHMLEIAAARLDEQGLDNWIVATADHRHIPLVSGSADLVISGWSFCYLVVWAEENWKDSLKAGLQEITRLLTKKGLIIIIETLGTGVETPDPPQKLLEYYNYLEMSGFIHSWLRTDYQFENIEEAQELVRFFFGEEMLGKIIPSEKPILPECTGIWWTSTSKLGIGLG